MGATQFAHTPSGTPVIAPRAVLAATLWKRRRGSRGSSVSSAAPKNRLKLMPTRLVHIQFTVVRPMRVATGICGVTGSFASKLNAPLVLIEVPECNFFKSDG